MRPIHAGLSSFALAALLACSMGGSPTVSRDELADQIDRGEAPLLLDVRSESEYAEGHLPGAVHIPFRSVDERYGELPVEKDEPIVVYCAHGPRAVWAARTLRDAGYTDVRFLDGHMSAWKQAELPTVTGEALADETP